MVLMVLDFSHSSLESQKVAKMQLEQAENKAPQHPSAFKSPSQAEHSELFIALRVSLRWSDGLSFQRPTRLQHSCAIGTVGTSWKPPTTLDDVGALPVLPLSRLSQIRFILLLSSKMVREGQEPLVKACDCPVTQMQSLQPIANPSCNISSG